ncbi:YxiJ-like family protein [Metabacillus idriensis]|uniref:YxiJ-like family protein n=1 Tax=Metabacillus idriensis TaxID=324768 RepID=UPI00203D199F|nr:YxiJ-like family protein [Metabacillus idriensis]MCM3597225.1 YxiJ-like family protein [Metabacillus idriensis]
MKNDLINNLKILYETELKNAFPYEDIEQIEKDFDGELSEEHFLTGDFNEFCMTIAGSSTYVISKEKIPYHQRQYLDKNFFSLYPQYFFLTDSVSKYPQFYKELMSFEKARLLLIEITQ